MEPGLALHKDLFKKKRLAYRVDGSCPLLLQALELTLFAPVAMVVERLLAFAVKLSYATADMSGLLLVAIPVMLVLIEVDNPCFLVLYR
ncbi:MAG: hypothetical protein RBR15_15760 [Sphaerochaeta sp.]|nr:hypothetical protein [Sphaerochaeta sp.]